MNNVIPLRNTGGFTRMDNSLMDALMVIDLPGRELKVALFIAKATINFQVGATRIKAAEVSKATNLHPDVVSRAISHLLKRQIIFREGGARGDIGFCDPKEWVYVECPSRTNLSDSDHSAVVVSIASQTKSDESLLYSKNEPLVTVSTKQITAPQGAADQPTEKQTLVSWNGEDFTVDPDLIAKWAKAYAPLDVDTEIVRAAAWAAGNRQKKDYRRFLVNWLARAFKKVADAPDETGVPVDKIIALYHKVCTNHAPVAVADPSLRRVIVERWNELESHRNSAFWTMIFERANRLSQVYYGGANVAPRLASICSRAIFRSLEEQA